MSCDRYRFLLIMNNNIIPLVKFDFTALHRPHPWYPRRQRDRHQHLKHGNCQRGACERIVLSASQNSPSNRLVSFLACACQQPPRWVHIGFQNVSRSWFSSGRIDFQRGNLGTAPSRFLPLFSSTLFLLFSYVTMGAAVLSAEPSAWSFGEAFYFWDGLQRVCDRARIATIHTVKRYGKPIK